MRRPEDLIELLARRGRHDDVDLVIERVERRLSGEPGAMEPRGRDDGWGPESGWRGKWLVAAASAAAVLLVVGMPVALLRGGGGDREPAGTATTTPVVTATTTPAATTLVTTSEPDGTSTTSAPSASTSVPAPTTMAVSPPPLGAGWRMAAESGEGPRWGWDVGGPSLDAVPGFGLVLTVGGAFEVSGDGNEWRHIVIDEGPGVSVRGIAMADGRLVASGSRCDDAGTSCEPVLWVSQDGEAWDAVAGDGLFLGCGGVAGWCEIDVGAPAAAPGIGFVVLGADRILPCGEECYDLDTVAWTSDDGLTWQRHRLAAGSLMPDGWTGGYTAPIDVEFVGGRFLTYAMLIGDPYSDVVFLESPDGSAWNRVEIRGAFDPSGIYDVAMGERGVLAITGWSAWTSSDGVVWSTADLAFPLGPSAVFDGGFVVACTVEPIGTESIWYSSDGRSWSEVRTPGLPGWNELAGFGPHLVALGVTDDNRDALWWWDGR